MRILMVTQAYYPFLEKGGPALKVRVIAESLAQRGHMVTVLTTGHNVEHAGKTLQIGGVEVVYQKPLLSYRSTTWNAGLVSFCRRRLRVFDVVHIYGLYDLLGPVVARYSRRRGVPYVLEPLGMTRPIDRNFRMKRAWHLLLGKNLVRCAALWVATSKQEQQELLEDGFPSSRTMLRYNGIDPQLFERLPPRGIFRKDHGIPPDEPLVLLLSRLIPRKGAGLLISAFAKACPVQGYLVIAGPEGEPGYVASLRGKVDECGVAARVIFSGPLYHEQKYAALQDADLFALPSQYENFANVVAEAIACGTPVAISDRCGMAELVEGRAGLVVPVEEDALVKALRDLLGDAALRKKFQQGCRQVAEELRWDKLIDQQESLYQRAIAERNACGTN